MEAGEPAELAVMREAQKETGLSDLEFVEVMESLRREAPDPHQVTR